MLSVFYFEIADYTAFIQKTDLPGCAVIVWIFQTASEEGHCQVFSHNFLNHVFIPCCYNSSPGRLMLKLVSLLRISHLPHLSTPLCHCRVACRLQAVWTSPTSQGCYEDVAVGAAGDRGGFPRVGGRLFVHYRAVASENYFESSVLSSQGIKGGLFHEHLVKKLKSRTFDKMGWPQESAQPLQTFKEMKRQFSV